jgi:uncharacterized lipoprotein NlpE involved in copper resistance
VHLKSIVQSVFSAIIIALLLTACENRAEVNFYDKNLHKTHLKCLKFHPAKEGVLEKELKQLYRFDDSCNNTLELSYKSGIVCNSRFNVAQKSTSSFPTAYLKLEVRNGFKLLYSYYIDLNEKPNKEELKEAFERLKEDIL